MMQESLAHYCRHRHGLPVAILRPAYVTDEDTLQDKYGRCHIHMLRSAVASGDEECLNPESQPTGSRVP
jgi:nucleoside-diphosphate-sugar epimerase